MFHNLYDFEEKDTTGSITVHRNMISIKTITYKRSNVLKKIDFRVKNSVDMHIKHIKLK